MIVRPEGEDGGAVTALTYCRGYVSTSCSRSPDVFVHTFLLEDEEDEEGFCDFVDGHYVRGRVAGAGEYASAPRNNHSPAWCDRAIRPLRCGLGRAAALHYGA